MNLDKMKLCSKDNNELLNGKKCETKNKKQTKSKKYNNENWKSKWGVDLWWSAKCIVFGSNWTVCLHLNYLYSFQSIYCIYNVHSMVFGFEKS